MTESKVKKSACIQPVSSSALGVLDPDGLLQVVRLDADDPEDTLVQGADVQRCSRRSSSRR
jgi:hypothetical protein